MAEKYYVDLMVSDDTDIGLLVIVQAETGVVYKNQVGGNSCVSGEVEGFAIPLGNRHSNDFADNLLKLFESYWCLQTLPDEKAISKLKELVASIPLWRHERPTVNPNGGLTWKQDFVQYLELDTDRLGDLLWAWIPVKTAYGPGILTFNNCD